MNQNEEKLGGVANRQRKAERSDKAWPAQGINQPRSSLAILDEVNFQGPPPPVELIFPVRSSTHPGFPHKSDFLLFFRLAPDLRLIGKERHGPKSGRRREGDCNTFFCSFKRRPSMEGARRLELLVPHFEL